MTGTANIMLGGGGTSLSVAAVSTATPTGTLDTALVLDKPAGAVSGDLLVAFYAGSNPSAGGASHNWTPPAGWTEVVDNGGALSLGLSWKAAGGGEPANYTWTGSAADYIGGAIIRIPRATFGAVGAPAEVTIPNLTLPSVNFGVPGLLLAFVTNYNAIPSITDMAEIARISHIGSEVPSFTTVFATPHIGGASGSRLVTYGSSSDAGGVLAVVGGA